MDYMEKEIPGYPEYLATSDGDIITLKRGERRKLTKTPTAIGARHVRIQPANGDQRYACRTVGSLILQAFVGPRPSKRHQAFHKNNNYSDDRLSNLEWRTRNEATKLAAVSALRSLHVHDLTHQLSDIIARFQDNHSLGQIAKAHNLHVHLVKSLRSALLGLVRNRDAGKSKKRQPAPVPDQTQWVPVQEYLGAVSRTGLETVDTEAPV